MIKGHGHKAQDEKDPFEHGCDPDSPIEQQHRSQEIENTGKIEEVEGRPIQDTANRYSKGLRKIRYDVVRAFGMGQNRWFKRYLTQFSNFLKVDFFGHVELHPVTDGGHFNQRGRDAVAVFEEIEFGHLVGTVKMGRFVRYLEGRGDPCKKQTGD